MNKKEKAKVKEKLLKRKKDLLSFVQLAGGKNPNGKDVNDIVDDAHDSYEQELSFQLSNNEQALLNNINEALQKIDAGTYGICEHCGEKISKARLKAVPFAKLCIKCQKSMSS